MEQHTERLGLRSDRVSEIQVAGGPGGAAAEAGSDAPSAADWEAEAEAPGETGAPEEADPAGEVVAWDAGEADPAGEVVAWDAEEADPAGEAVAWAAGEAEDAGETVVGDAWEGEDAGEAVGRDAGETALGAALDPDEPEQRPATGEPRVDAALARLDDLADRPVTEHRAIFEDVHRRLREVLGELDTREQHSPDQAATGSERRAGR